MKIIDLRSVFLTANSAKTSVAVVFFLYSVVTFLVRATLGLNTFEFGDETEKFVAAQMINSGMRLYLDIFAHHGPVTYIIAHVYSSIVSVSNFTQIRWFMVGLAIIAAFSLYLSPAFRLLTSRLIVTGLFLSLLSVIWILQGTHMILYHQIGGFLFIVIFAQLFLPLLVGANPNRPGLIISGFCAATMCFTAYAFGPSVVFLVLASILLSYRLGGYCCARYTFLFVSIGATIAAALIVFWLYLFADIKGFFVYHFYFNQEIYSKFIGFSLKSLQNLLILNFNPNEILHSFGLLILVASSLIALSFNKAVAIEKTQVFLYLSICLFVLSAIFLSPRGGTGFHGVGFLVASLAIFSASASFFLQRDNANFGFGNFLRTFFILFLVLFVFEKASSVALSSPHGVRKDEFSKHIIYMKPTEGASLISELARHEKDFIALIFNPAIYIANGILPASGHYYYLPWQAAYNRRSIEGYKIDICNDIKIHKPTLIWFDNWKVWDKYSIFEYEPCVPNLIDSGYRRINDSGALYVRSDRLVKSPGGTFSNQRKLIPSSQLEASNSIKLHLLINESRAEHNLIKIGIMFGTYTRNNAGEAELVLTSRDGSKYSRKFYLGDLIDNQYRYFDVEVADVVAGEVRSLSGGGVSTWESHDDSETFLTCINYIYSDQKISLTPGCP